MPISIVVGGQFGSEGKGKVSHYVAREDKARAVVRVGGPNSGHTVYSDDGQRYIFQHLPTAAILPGVLCVLAAGSYIDVEQLLFEISLCKLDPARLKIDPHAVVITAQDRVDEHLVGLRAGIGSTLTGTGAAVVNRISRTRPLVFAKDVSSLRSFLVETKELLGQMIEKGDRVVIEGTQGYGLSVLHTPCYPFATSRDTTASGFLSEVGLSPIDVDDIVLVIRAFPIRVPGNSGPLSEEFTWSELTKESESSVPIVEMTSVTKSVRRVARFTPDIVISAMRSNRPTRIVLNHVDYFDRRGKSSVFASKKHIAAALNIERVLQRQIDFFGMSEVSLISRDAFFSLRERA